MLKAYNAILQNNNAEIDINNGKLIAMTNYTISGNSTLIMNDPNDYVYVNGEFYFNTSIEHNQNYLNNGLIQVVGHVFQVNSSGSFLPGGSHKVYLNCLDIIGNTTIGFNNDYVSKFNILGINKPLSKYTFNPSDRPISTWYNQLIFLGSEFYIKDDNTLIAHWYGIYYELTRISYIENAEYKKEHI
ncbi:hypothetical protein [Acetivibrio mesophilus]|uniref:Uncharacterized protein n=1 Tax=Acetivibrio mesophilus TaxID=2487273 RepID=A0A4Q0I4S4_9FIRM|nr:hypothetical protein [Acetivibrio mesophilus]RXE57942.1 hypothetical protein EFD62_15040 [Acetivibrio mesophilus]